MKVLLINTTYNIGSTGKLVYNFRNYLIQQGNEVLTLYGQGNSDIPNKNINISSIIERKIHNVLGRVTGLNGCFSFFSTNEAISIINDFSPDIIYLGNLHGHYINIYRLYDYFRARGFPIVKIMWDEYAMTGACAFSFDCKKYEGECGKCPQKKAYPISYFFDTSRLLQNKKKHAFMNQRICFVSVPYIINCASKSLLLHNSVLYAVDEAVDQQSLYYPRNPENIRKELEISDDKRVVLNVCPYPDYRKGGSYYLDLARRCLQYDDLVFVHVGFMGNKSECPKNYIPIGYERDQNRMAYFYSMADIFVCTSLAETQPNTCIEALSCGTPICGFDISGIPTCAEEPYGCFVKARDVDELMKVVIRTKKKTPEEINSVRRYAESRFSSTDYNMRLYSIGKQLIGEKQ